MGALAFKTWASRTIDLLRKIHGIFEDNHTSWENFLAGDISYFWNEGSDRNIAEPATKSLINIKAQFCKLCSLKIEIKSLIQSLNEDITRDV